MNNITILVIEDNPFDYETTFRKLNYMSSVNKIIHKEESETAIAYLFQTGEFDNTDNYIKPDLILLDVMMPKIIGTEVLKKIKKEGSDEIKNIPVIMLTSLTDKLTNKECFNLGAIGFLVKPIQTKYLEDFLIKLDLIK